MRGIKGLLILFVVILFVACDSNRIAEDWIDIPTNGWNKDSVCTFTTNLTDTANYVDLYIGIRNKNTYSFSNLWLFISIISPDNQAHVDTFEINLATPYGKWYGKGWGDLYSVQVPYRKKVRFLQQGDYHFQVQQGMRNDVLKGIESIGFRIEKSIQKDGER